MAEKRIYINSRVYLVNEHRVRKFQALWKGFWTRKQLAGLRQVCSDITAEIEQNDDIKIQWARKLPCKPKFKSKHFEVEDDYSSQKAESILSEEAGSQCKTKSSGNDSNGSDSETEITRIQQTGTKETEPGGVSQSGEGSPEGQNSLNQSGEGSPAEVNSNGSELSHDTKHTEDNKVHIHVKTDVSIQTDISESNHLNQLNTGPTNGLSSHVDRHENVDQVLEPALPGVYKDAITHEEETTAPSVTETNFNEQNKGQGGSVDQNDLNENMQQLECLEPETDKAPRDKGPEPVLMGRDVPLPIGLPRQSSSPTMPTQRFSVADSYQTSVWESTQELYGGNTEGKDGTSVWNTDASAQDSVQFDHQVAEKQEEQRQTKMLQEVDNERNHIAMELLWIQQAIESRKQYLRLKTKITAEDH